jgi:putative ABC transport system permease protein
MLSHYLKIALRNVLKQKAYSFINIFGLALGIACCVLVILFMRHERSYDLFHESGQRIFRVNLEKKTPAGSMELSAGQPIPLAPALRASFPEVQYATRLKSSSGIVRASDENATRETVFFADQDFFKMFSFPFVHGDAASALAQKSGIVLSEGAAQKYFGSEFALGKTMSVSFSENFVDFIVSGVVKKMPGNSSMQFDFMLLYENSPNYANLANVWTSWGAVTFIQLANGASAEALQNKFEGFIKNYYGELIQTWQILGWMAKEDGALKLKLQPLANIHLESNVQNSLLPTSNPMYSYILAGIGMIVLLIACINFTTLAISRAASRMQEIGVRKTLGAFRGQLMKQFWGEALLFSVLALFLGLALAEAFLPVFNALANRTLAISYFAGWELPAIFLGLGLFVGLAAGSYPALFLSRFQPVETLKNRIRLGNKNRLSQTLVVVQFSLSVLLIICTLVMSEQLHLLKNANPGFNEEQIVVIPANTKQGEGEKLLTLYRQKLAGQAQVLGLTGNSDGFNKETGWKAFGTASGANWQVNLMRIDPEFIRTFGMQIVHGRDFSPEMTADATGAVIVNEALVKEFGWQEAVGRKFEDFELRGVHEPTIIGVVKDFNYASLHETVKPMVLHLDPTEDIKYLFAKIAPGSFATTLEALRNAWQEIAPEKPFDYYFLDEDFDQQYRAEERWAQIVIYSTSFAIIIACIGLLGLSALAVTKRTKEIGIRKVLGASAFSVVRLLTNEFMILVALANVLAWPVAYFAMNEWLQDFAYRIEIGWQIFGLAGLAALLLALLTVSLQAIKTALGNPVEALRYE